MTSYDKYKKYKNKYKLIKNMSSGSPTGEDVGRRKAESSYPTHGVGSRTSPVGRRSQEYHDGSNLPHGEETLYDDGGVGRRTLH